MNPIFRKVYAPPRFSGVLPHNYWIIFSLESTKKMLQWKIECTRRGRI